MQLWVKGEVSCLAKGVESPVSCLDVLEFLAFVYLLEMTICKSIYTVLESRIGLVVFCATKGTLMVITSSLPLCLKGSLRQPNGY